MICCFCFIYSNYHLLWQILSKDCPYEKVSRPSWDSLCLCSQISRAFLSAPSIRSLEKHAWTPAVWLACAFMLHFCQSGFSHFSIWWNGFSETHFAFDVFVLSASTLLLTSSAPPALWIIPHLRYQCLFGRALGFRSFCFWLSAPNISSQYLSLDSSKY